MNDTYISRIGVIHLVWPALGICAPEAFANSYEQCPAGVNHQLVVLLKEGGDPSFRTAIETRFNALGATVYLIPDKEYDIGPYFRIAAEAKFQYLCFLNSYSTILCTGWLAKMFARIEESGVGLVGATGSFESPHSVARMESNPYQVAERKIREAQFKLRAPEGSERQPLSTHRLHNKIPDLLRRARHGWNSCMARRNFLRDFDPFPNAHIRTNAFLISREHFLNMAFSGERTKMDSLRFEAGRNGMTQQLKSLGLEALVVGRDGVGYREKDWATSRIYRSGEQENLLIADNRTRQYESANQSVRVMFQEITWGKYSSILGPTWADQRVSRPTIPI